MYRLQKLPYKKEYISTNIYKYLSDANYTLGELKGYLDTTPYLTVIIKLINTYEAKNSSEIVNINTTCKNIFIQRITNKKNDSNTTEAIHHMRAINILYKDLIIKNKLVMSDINNVQKLLIPNNAGIRKVRGHKIYNKVTHEVLRIPPQNKNAILEYYQNLIDYINDEHLNYDPLIKMAIVHYQFECIHPYKDGNGRIGRILNTVSLIQSRRLNHPILNLSKYLSETNEMYFSLLEKCHNNINHLDEFIIYMLKGIKETTKFTISLIEQITRVINNTRSGLIEQLPKIYSPNLLIHLFKFPYTKNELLRTELNLSRTTSTKYLKLLEDHNFVESSKYGKEIVYKNIQLLHLFDSNI